MRYNVVKDASRIIKKSNYIVENPKTNKNNWNKVFGNSNPICLELGMGRGEFIKGMAKKYPNKNFIGLELDENQIATAASKLEGLNLSNLKLIHADASTIAEIFGKEIDTIYLTFSEPWPKPHDEKKRFTHPSYLRIYDRVFKKHKHIIMKTDNKKLFAYSLETLSQYWYSFERVSLDLHRDENPIENIMTDFKTQYYKEGRPIYYVDAKFES